MLPPTPSLPPPIARRTSHLSGWRQLVAATLVCASVGSTVAWAQADEYAEVNRLVRAGQLNEALVKIDQYLASKPRDPQMRFMKGVIQTESGKTVDAITTFSKLTEDFPELPEPYNNLAVLYAAQSQFDKARAALEMAIRTNPSYATAHENLGDVYAKLASQAYSKALQLDTNNTGVPPKLSLIRNVFSGTAIGKAPPLAVMAAKPAAPAPAAPTSPEAASKPAVIAAAPATVAPAAPAVTANGQSEVQAAVSAWAKAWSDRNMDAYLGAYAPAFVPAGGQNRRAWEADRTARIVPRSRIGVDVSDLSIDVKGNRATARFLQAYSSDTLNVSSRKTLELVRNGGRWLIVRESTGS
ncbi:MAG: tetratricopeptide (TPR) repeat protein [Hydrogenophaga sp.]|jgi:tetratricopeptide (TPR) repeat protein